MVDLFYCRNDVLHDLDNVFYYKRTQRTNFYVINSQDRKKNCIGLLMAIKKSLVKVFNAKYVPVPKEQRKYKFCNLKLIGNEDKFHKYNLSRCIKCDKKEKKKKRDKLKKRNIWNLK